MRKKHHLTFLIITVILFCLPAAGCAEKAPAPKPAEETGSENISGNDENLSAAADIGEGAGSGDTGKEGEEPANTASDSGEELPYQPSVRIMESEKTGEALKEVLIYSDDGYTATLSSEEGQDSIDHINKYTKTGECVSASVKRYSSDVPEGEFIKECRIDHGLLKKYRITDDDGEVHEGDLSDLLTYDAGGRIQSASIALFGLENASVRIPELGDEKLKVVRLFEGQKDETGDHEGPECLLEDGDFPMIDFTYQRNKVIAEYMIDGHTYDEETKETIDGAVYYLRKEWEYNDAGMLVREALMCSFDPSDLVFEDLKVFDISMKPEDNTVYSVRTYEYDANGNLLSSSFKSSDSDPETRTYKYPGE
ncbi:MAG: hypothetical protein K6F53_11630 [Lachnospiraceae bacterium]|nr:hypothetical protein [Lachnospiraceae bacterium]